MDEGYGERGEKKKKLIWYHWNYYLNMAVRMSFINIHRKENELFNEHISMYNLLVKIVNDPKERIKIKQKEFEAYEKLVMGEDFYFREDDNSFPSLYQLQPMRKDYIANANYEDLREYQVIINGYYFLNRPDDDVNTAKQVTILNVFTWSNLVNQTLKKAILYSSKFDTIISDKISDEIKDGGEFAFGRVIGGDDGKTSTSQ